MFRQNTRNWFFNPLRCVFKPFFSFFLLPFSLLSHFFLPHPHQLQYQNSHINLRNSKKYFLARGVKAGRGGNIFIFFIIRDRTFKHKYNYFHINQINLYKNNFLPGARRGRGVNIYFFFIIRDRTFKQKFNIFFYQFMSLSLV